MELLPALLIAFEVGSIFREHLLLAELPLVALLLRLIHRKHPKSLFRDLDSMRFLLEAGRKAAVRTLGVHDLHVGARFEELRCLRKP